MIIIINFCRLYISTIWQSSHSRSFLLSFVEKFHSGSSSLRAEVLLCIFQYIIEKERKKKSCLLDISLHIEYQIKDIDKSISISISINNNKKKEKERKKIFRYCLLLVYIFHFSGIYINLLFLFAQNT